MRLPRPALAVAGIAASLALGACAGDDPGAAGRLERAFSQSVESADVTLDLRARLRGSPEHEDPMRVRASGPYVSGGTTEIPSLDWDVTVDGRGMGFSGRVVSNGENAWVEVLGTAYEVGEDAVARANRHVQRHKRGGRPGLDELGLDPSRWLVDPREEGSEDVAGVETTHYSAGLDVARFLDDLEAAAVRAGRPPDAGLTPDERRRIVEAVEEPSFDVWLDERDVIRRLTAEVAFTVPEQDRARHHGVESGELIFLLELADVGGNQSQRIRVPREARPIEELLDGIGHPRMPRAPTPRAS